MFSTFFQTDLGLTHPPAQWKPQQFPRRKAIGARAIHLEPRLTMSRVILPFPCVPAWHVFTSYTLYSKMNPQESMGVNLNQKKIYSVASSPRC